MKRSRRDRDAGPNDDPGAGGLHYCLIRHDGTIVDKTHIPYELSHKARADPADVFVPEWEVKNLPGYADEIAGNPFATFADIPVRALPVPARRCRYEINTFVKGPVCNGSIAVNAIQEQFFIFSSDPTPTAWCCPPIMHGGLGTC